MANRFMSRAHTTEFTAGHAGNTCAMPSLPTHRCGSSYARASWRAHHVSDPHHKQTARSYFAICSCGGAGCLSLLALELSIGPLSVIGILKLLTPRCGVAVDCLCAHPA